MHEIRFSGPEMLPVALLVEFRPGLRTDVETAMRRVRAAVEKAASELAPGAIQVRAVATRPGT